MPRTLTLDLNPWSTTRELIQTEVATEEELLEFANKVREAGGANPLEALLPSVPKDENSCLIARALNFESIVTNESHNGKDTWDDRSFRWVMQTTPDRARAIAKALDLGFDIWDDEEYPESSVGNVHLPKHIGNAAHAFDQGVAFQDFVENDDE